MPFNGNGGINKLFMSKDEILKAIEDEFGGMISQIQNDDVGGGSSTGAFEYQVSTRSIRFGIISSMTDSFCGSCNRIRLTSDGRLRNCLFSDESDEVDLIGMMRQGATDDDLERAIRECVVQKFFSHGGRHVDELWTSSRQLNRPMIRIGG
jgi:cyclic pyranopterin phosphate synthase